MLPAHFKDQYGEAAAKTLFYGKPLSTYSREELELIIAYLGKSLQDRGEMFRSTLETMRSLKR